MWEYFEVASHDKNIAKQIMQNTQPNTWTRCGEITTSNQNHFRNTALSEKSQSVDTTLTGVIPHGCCSVNRYVWLVYKV